MAILAEKARSSPDTKIDDVGERLEGARKDMRRKIAESLANVTEAALIEKPFGKVYKKPDLKKAVESGAHTHRPAARTALPALLPVVRRRVAGAHGALPQPHGSLLPHPLRARGLPPPGRARLSGPPPPLSLPLLTPPAPLRPFGATAKNSSARYLVLTK